MNSNLLAARLGLTAEPPAKPKAQASPVGHLSTALAHAKAGKHHEAKQHALKAVNALHRLSQPAAQPSAPAAPAPAAPAV
jgi:hypothetical protein